MFHFGLHAAVRLLIAFTIITATWLWDAGHLRRWWRHGVAVWRARVRRRVVK